MPDPKEHQLALIAEAIQRYLRDHPRAADSLEGIADWWLASECYQQTQEEVQQALDHLVAKGLLTRTELLNGRVVYSATKTMSC